jgi:tRNA(fMet)-specific endonuclease VapC
MKNIVIDTCVFINIVRDNDAGKNCLKAIEEFDENVNVIVSVVTKAELFSLIIQNNWGKPKLDKLSEILNNVTFIDIANADKDLIESYKQIDAFSKRKITDKFGNYLNGSAKKMGKNDLWIAATALSLDIPLITTDGDFDHLNSTFLNVMRVI